MYVISPLRAKDVQRTHKLPRAHKSYTYTISRLQAKDVFCTQSRLQSAKAVHRDQKPYNLRTQTATGVFNKSTRNIFFKYDFNLFLLSCILSTLSVMSRRDQGKPTRINRDWIKARKGITAPISLEDLMERRM